MFQVARRSQLIYIFCSNRISLGLQTRLEQDLKTSAEAVDNANRRKLGPDEESSNSGDDDDNGNKGSTLTIRAAKVIIKTGLQKLLGMSIHLIVENEALM